MARVQMARLATQQETLSTPLAVSSRVCTLFEFGDAATERQQTAVYQELVELLQAKLFGVGGNLKALGALINQHDVSLLFLHFLLESFTYELNLMTARPKPYMAVALAQESQQKTSGPPEIEEDIEKLAAVRSYFSQDILESAEVRSSHNFTELLSELHLHTSRRFNPGQEKDVFSEWRPTVKQIYNNPTFDLFYGVLLHRDRCCACKETSSYFSLFSGINADLEYFQAKKGSRSVPTVSLEEVIERNFSPITDDMHWCSSCRFKVVHERESFIYEPPLLMLIDLQNGSQAFERSTFFRINHIGLDVSAYSDHPNKFREVPYYTLRGFLCAHKTPVDEKGKSTSQSSMSNFKLGEYELVYYCDTVREWLCSSSLGVKTSENMFRDKNNISYCLYEYSPQPL